MLYLVIGGIGLFYSVRAIKKAIQEGDSRKIILAILFAGASTWIVIYGVFDVYERVDSAARSMMGIS